MTIAADFDIAADRDTPASAGLGGRVLLLAAAAVVLGLAVAFPGVRPLVWGLAVAGAVWTTVLSGLLRWRASPAD